MAVDDIGIEVAFVTSERLYDDQRAVIERVFGCRVANGYGGRDAGFVAHECPMGGMHVTAEDIVVEIVDETGAAVGVEQPGRDRRHASCVPRVSRSFAIEPATSAPWPRNPAPAVAGCRSSRRYSGAARTSS